MGASGTWATPSRFVLTLSSSFLSFLILRSSMYLKYTLAFSTGVSLSPPVTSMVMRVWESDFGVAGLGAEDEEGEEFCAAMVPARKSAAAKQEQVEKVRENLISG